MQQHMTIPQTYMPKTWFYTQSYMQNFVKLVVQDDNKIKTHPVTNTINEMCGNIHHQAHLL